MKTCRQSNTYKKNLLTSVKYTYYSYDNDDQRATPNGTASEKYTYKNGRLASLKVYDTDRSLTHTETYTYKNGRLVTKNEKPNGSKDVIKTTYMYKSGRLSREYTVYPDWYSSNSNDIRYYYDKKGRIAKTVTTKVYYDKTVTSTTTSVYSKYDKYNHAGKIVSTYKSVQKGSKPKSTVKETYTYKYKYNKNGAMTQEIEYLDGKPQFKNIYSGFVKVK